MVKLALSDEILMSVEKPARYIGNEINSIKKDPAETEIRFCMCFPDVYEIGMSHLGIQILYAMLNEREDIYCERVYSPWVDLDKILRDKNIPLFSLETQSPIKDFDFLGITRKQVPGREDSNGVLKKNFKQEEYEKIKRWLETNADTES